MRTRENPIKTFWREVFMTGSPIPFILLGQVSVFVIIYTIDLLFDVKIIPNPLYETLISKLSLPQNLTVFIQQPWSIITHSFVYTGLFKILFDCLWLYWIGNLFLTFLNRRQFLFIYICALFLNAGAYLAAAQIPALQHNILGSLLTSTGSLVAIVAATACLLPTYEMRLFLFGNIKLRTIAWVFIAFEIIFYIFTNKPAAVGILVSSAFGIAYIKALQQGNDWSKIFRKPAPKSKLKVVHTDASRPLRSGIHELPNQEAIDQILDKISLSGYDSLTAQEKEILFRASKH